MSYSGTLDVDLEGEGITVNGNASSVITDCDLIVDGIILGYDHAVTVDYFV